MPNLYAQETWVNATEGHGVGESDVYETFTDDPGELYRAMRDEYGRCTGKVYIDAPDGKPCHVGWVFLKRERYQDVDETYLQETWVTLHDAPDTVTRSRAYHAI